MNLNLLEKLNDKQREAASQIDGSILILAGAGSGKTRTITYRIAHMIENVGISPYSILAVTFTNKAAKEMRERVEELVGDIAKACTISTFHSFGMRLLRMYAKEVEYNSNFTIYDTDDQKRIVKAILKGQNISLNGVKLTERDIVSMISKIKEEIKTLDEYSIMNKQIVEVYDKYNRVLLESNAMDFSDILLNTYKLLQKPEILEKVQNKYKYIMIDEYQDTNNLQYKIIDLIARKSSNLCVVGDENQSIYGFRGANILNILNFETNYNNAKIIKLEENYRSTTTILDAANELIKNNKSSKDKKLWTQNGKGDLIKVLACDNARDEVSRIIEIIKENHQNGIAYRDMTILYRTNAQSRVFEEGFLRYSIPHKVFGGISFYSRAEIKDIIAYLSIIVNPQDELNLQRIINVPKRKVGEKGVEKIIAYARENNLNLLEALSHIKEISGLTAVGKEKLLEMYDIIKELKDLSYTETASYIVQTLIDKIKYIDYVKENYDDAEARIENIDEFKNSILELENVVGELRLNEYLENVSLISATDDLEEKSDYVKLMTIHNSKGLEFPIVFLVGFENEIFPGSRAMFEEKEMEEERRLCYVALTRAEKKLYLSHATIRFVYGQDRLSTPSVFLKEIPEKLLDIDVKKERLYFEDDYSNEIKAYDNSRKFEKKKTEINTKNTIKFDDNTKKIIDNLGFKVGDKVKHKKFGLGVIKNIDAKKIYVQYVDGTKEMAIILADKLLTKFE
ncbi:UvrD-helicase domain-containing protein (plasmid) [Fusobacterium vincentii]|uniref:ATP-dependent helicase n=1 Tax=Fusobacterium TaxID=848 RepID=UPI001EEE75D1|nr:UvrD-helicase domain-containing protein [Fusobacterium nucleatum]MCG6836563.1 UvrD-helicase domain-containing protein [Fusobacterium nucleatum]